jgi:hypothetical protein
MDIGDVMLPRIIYVLLGSFCIQHHASAAVLEWPNASSFFCSASLQACINSAAPGDVVEIVTLAPTILNQNILINRAITLRSGVATRARFQGGSITVDASAPGTTYTTLSHLDLSNTTITVNSGSANPSDEQTVELDQLRIRQTSPTYAITLSTAAAPSQKHVFITYLNYYGNNAIQNTGVAQNIDHVIADSNFHVTTGNIDLINESALNAGSQVRIQRNRFETPVALPNYIYIRVRSQTAGSAPASGTVGIAIDRNEFLRAGAILMNEGLHPITARVGNNTFVDTSFTLSTANLSASSGNLIRMANNIVVRGQARLNSPPTSTLHTVANNLYFGVLPAEMPPFSEPGRVIGDPQFKGPDDFRLQGVSPARNAGNNANNPFIIGALDFDGQPTLAESVIDIGAHEYTDALSSLHTASNSNLFGANGTQLPLSVASPILADLPQAMHTFAGGIGLQPSSAAQHLGFYTAVSNSVFALFNQSGSSMAIGTQFFVLHTGLRDSERLHTTSIANNTPFINVTRLNDPQLNGHPEALPVVSQRWNPAGGIGVYNDDSIGLWYTEGFWHVFNQGPLPNPMPIGAGFHVLIPDSFADYAYRLDIPSARSAIELDHSRLNENPCAQVYASLLYGDPQNIAAFSGAYVRSEISATYQEVENGGRWVLLRADGADFPAGTVLHIYIDPVSSRKCSEDNLLRNGFE